MNGSTRYTTRAGGCCSSSPSSAASAETLVPDEAPVVDPDVLLAPPPKLAPLPEPVLVGTALDPDWLEDGVEPLWFPAVAPGPEAVPAAPDAEDVSWEPSETQQ